jgi:hypothetical protein
MSLRPWRRSRVEPLRPAATPPPDGAAGCLDAYSRNWEREPLAGVFVDWSDAGHFAGFGAGFCGVWHEDEPLVPIERFPIGPEGIQAANALLRRVEVLPLLEARILTGARLVAHAGEMMLLLAQEREQSDWHVHAGVTESAWFAHAFSDALPDLPRTPPGSATLADARERLADEWDGELEWDAVPPTVPRGLLDTARWALSRQLAAAS